MTELITPRADETGRTTAPDGLPLAKVVDYDLRVVHRRREELWEENGGVRTPAERKALRAMRQGGDGPAKASRRGQPFGTSGITPLPGRAPPARPLLRGAGSAQMIWILKRRPRPAPAA